MDFEDPLKPSKALRLSLMGQIHALLTSATFMGIPPLKEWLTQLGLI